jgi:hypothetical protein
MHGLVDFYEPVDTNDPPYQRGQFYWVTLAYIPDAEMILRYWHHGTQMMNVHQFDPNREKLDKEADTKADEFHAVLTFKRRPALVLSTGGTPTDHAPLMGDYYLVAPVHSLRDPVTGEYKCSQDFVYSTLAYSYNTAIYLEDSGADLKESYVRLDKCTSIHRSWFGHRLNVRLSDEMLDILTAWHRYYLTGKIGKDLDDLVQYYRAELAKDDTIRRRIFRT